MYTHIHNINFHKLNNERTIHIVTLTVVWKKIKVNRGNRLVRLSLQNSLDIVRANIVM